MAVIRTVRAAVAALVAVGALAGCGAAQTDAEHLYLEQMQQHPLHFPGTDLQIPDKVAVGLGQLVCTTLRNPQVTDSSAVKVAPTGYGNLSAEDTTMVVAAAAGSLCPDVQEKVAAARR